MFDNFFKKGGRPVDLDQTQKIEEAPVSIKRPENQEVLEVLKRKLDEYEVRMNKARGELEADPKNEKADLSYWDSMYKFVFLGNLLKNGEVVESEIAAALSDAHNGIKYADRLNNAFKVVKAYVEGGDLTGGTGLKINSEIQKGSEFYEGKVSDEE
jgi:hypothetical protein